MHAKDDQSRQSWIDAFLDVSRHKPEGASMSEVRSCIIKLDDILHRNWKLGKNIILAWTPSDDGLDILIVPHHSIIDYITSPNRIEEVSFIFQIISGRKQVTPRWLKRISAALGTEIVGIDLGFATGRWLDDETVEALIRRYSLSHGTDRAVALFDAVGFSLLSPLEQVTQLNSLAYSVNSAHSKLRDRSITIKFARSTTGDGFYIWNRTSSLQANRDLYHFMHLILADNAIAQRKATSNSVPKLRAAFHIGDHYEFYQSEGLSPTTFSYIVGDVTIELARMIERAIPGQIIMGDFDITTSHPLTGQDWHLDTREFIETAQLNLADLNGLVLSDDEISDIKVYLTGPPVKEGGFGINRYRIQDKHGRSRSVFNAKVNIYRQAKDPIFLGIQDNQLGPFETIGVETLAG